ncbi:hypothetical protein N658DRAFT_460870 [Parathielavia hyrcaniae]|uniref:MOZ protein represents a chromatin-associated acetyltransferase n=1 Tax=Parathielavia hyrcaniae TaxID=113614 RepID=A0AAN6Q9Z5_9PEZI|nr:hypothetical protein N658DRAFT_460870 [Parathielavia hyrcaniae]
MAAQRLTFLYPHLFRAGGRWTEPPTSQAVRTSHRKQSSARFPTSPCCQHSASFTTLSERRQAAFAKRAGKAIEPLSLDGSVSEPKSEGGKPVGQDAAKATTKPTPTPPPPSAAGSQQAASPAQLDLPTTIELPPPGDIDPITQTKKGSPMDEILHPGPPPPDTPTPPPSSTIPAPEQPSHPNSQSSTDTGTGPNTDTTTTTTITTSPFKGTKPPHLTPPSYIHHFDSYTLVKQLTAGGYTLAQAILAMKAIRSLLATNLDVAQAGLVSKADVENETYLFRAACSELSAEVRNNRRVADEQLRQQRTLLQHEVDILAQRLNQELLTLNDSVRGMFNDRRMAVREEQKAVESRIQQINYKISVTLNSDARSDIEGLRWVLIRRSVLGIIFMAVLTLSTIRYTTYMGRKRQKEAERLAKEAEEMKKNDGRSDKSPGPDAAEILAAN